MARPKALITMHELAQIATARKRPDKRSTRPTIKSRAASRVRPPPHGGSISINFPFAKIVPPEVRAACETLLRHFLPSELATARSQISDAAAHVDAFIHARCERDQAGVERASTLLTSYGSWARANDLPPLSAKALSGALAFLGFRRRKSSVVLWCGLRLRK